MDNAHVSENYLPVKSIDFSSAKSKKKKLDESIDGASQVSTSSERLDRSPVDEMSVPTTDEMNGLYQKLSQTKSKPGILSLIPKYSSNYVPITSLPEFPQPLTLLYDPNNLKLKYHELLKKCESM